MRLSNHLSRASLYRILIVLLGCLGALSSWPGRQPVLAQASGAQQNPAQVKSTHTLGEAIANAKPGVERRSIPLDHLYWHFFVYQRHLDQVADLHDQQGKDGRWLRTHFQTELHFSDGEFAAVRTASDSVIPAVTQMNLRAQTIRTADHLARKRREFTDPAASPGLAELKQLNKDRDDLLHTTVATMNSALGSTKAAVLAEYLQKHLAATVQPLALPSSTPFPVMAEGSVAAATKQVQK